MAFEVAIYTDVLASEALDGVDGFNFQAASPGISGVDQQRIRESLLHRVIPSWLLAHDELSHPPTCAYLVQGDRSYLARGKSTGTTNSGRPGNQLTQAIVTSDPGDFVPYRPAQLYGALEWSLEKAPGPELEPWVTPLEIRPEFEVPALEQWVRDDAWAVAILPHYLTMIDQALAAEPTKLVLLHTDLDVVMRWIALGTLFLDAETCRTVQFRALVDDPWRVDAAIVGVSPDFGAGGLGAANVLDLAGRGTPAVAVSDAARIRATWFLEQGADDALNAIEIARRWEPSLGSVLATEAARIVALPEDGHDRRGAWRTSMTVIEQLANAGLRDDLALYAEELCEAAVGYGPASEEEFRLAGSAIRRAHESGVDEVASGIAVATLEALATVPEQAPGFAQQLAGAELPISWVSADAEQAAGSFLGEVLQAAPATALPDVFAAGRILGCSVPESSLRPAVANLAARWFHEPALGTGHWQHWLAGESVLHATGWHVLNALRSGERRAWLELLRGDWDLLAFLQDPALEGWLTAARLGRLPAEERADRLAVTSGIPSDAWWIVLAGSVLPTHAHLWASWISYHGLSDGLAAEIRSQLQRALGASSGSTKEVPAGDWSPVMPSLGAAADPELARLAGRYGQAHAALRNARHDLSAHPEARLDGCLGHVSRWAPLFLPDIGWLLLNSADAGEVTKLLNAASPWGPAAVRAAILRLVGSGRGFAAIDYALYARGHPDKELAAAADHVLAELVDRWPDLIDGARRQPKLQDDLEKYLRQRSQGTKRRHGGLLGRGKES